ncbi:hypothetical protein HNP33_002555 [Comamonas odontotermitis]|uniref:Tip attachment protein J domain-containing protein n=1 Tax=Comamonas odontotermitis TaxID=379895 RepID=A0ABR6RHC3_9BURK|nr:hypothetical protein [Comamonas odontotermitis]MBB6578473.1 hypothetical protein [Comamonas odontotermitis]
MTILESDIVLRKSIKMDDTDNGGGGPGSELIPFGGNNNIFRDLSAIDRAGGRVQIRQIFLGIQSPNADPALGVHLFISKPPTDPNVSVVLVKCSTFATRAQIAKAIEGYLVRSVEIGPYLLEDHVKGSRSIDLFHRPGTQPPGVNDTLFLTIDEGKPTERVEPIRITRVATEPIKGTVSINGGFEDYDALKSKCDLADPLQDFWPGSPPSRSFGRDTSKTRVRSASVADSADFYGASYLTTPAQLGDRTVRVDSIFGQIVPNTRSERSSIDQRPAAARTLTLATTPRLVEIGTAAHTDRILVTAANQGYSFVRQMRPVPARGSVTVSYRAGGNWYELRDQGDGNLTSDGAGVGRYNVQTGSLAMDFAAVPDVGSFILIQWADNIGFTNRSGGSINLAPPEYCFVLPDQGVMPETMTILWPSGSTTALATVSATGDVSGDATGVFDAPSSTMLLRPLKMPDPGAEFAMEYQVDNVITELLTPSAVDAGGFVTVNLAQQPAARSLQLRWVTARSVSGTSGANQTTTNAIKDVDVTYTIRSVPEYYAPAEQATASTGATITYPKVNPYDAVRTDTKG